MSAEVEQPVSEEHDRKSVIAEVEAKLEKGDGDDEQDPEGVVNADELLEGNQQAQEEVLKKAREARVSLVEDEDTSRKKKLRKRKSAIGLEVSCSVVTRK
jgi:hypothetical protein